MSEYAQLPEVEKERIRASALAYYHRNRKSISVKRKMERDTNPDYKIKRKQREESPKYRKMRRTYHLRRNYGITLEQYNKMFENQSGKCAICLEKFEHLDTKHVHIDHNHTTGQIRQLLCSGCNCALGNLNENIDTFKRAAKYLTMWRQKHEQ